MDNAICRQAFAPPLVRFPPGADDTALQSSAQQAGATLEPMLSQLESTITHSGVQPAATFMLAYRDLYSALAGFPESGGAAAAVNVGQLVQSVSAQARALDIPACAPG